MEIKLAKEMGFCFGVRKAIDIVADEALKRRAEGQSIDITTYGAVVHNPRVNDKMQSLGVNYIDRGDLGKIPTRTIAFTAHGTAPQVIQEARERGLAVIDATCPLVTLIQDSAQRMAEQGFFVIVYGDRNHPEVKSIMGHAGKNAIATMDSADLKGLKPPKRIGIVSQSTQILEHFKQFVVDVNMEFLGKTKEITVHNTICAPTTRLQSSAEELARECAVMVVVGGKASANTQHLADICRAEGARTYKIESAAELDPAWFAEADTVGVTAGASTPDESIHEVVARLRTFEHQPTAAAI